MRIASRVTIGILLIPVLATAVHAQNQSARTEAYLRSFHDLGRFNGAALIMDQGRILFEGGFGFADLESQVAVDATTRFRIASLTKQFTAALILRLAEEEFLDLHAPVRTLIDEYPVPNGERITTHQLLTHTSGLPSYTDIPGFMEDRTTIALSPAEIVALTWNEPLRFEPGTQFEYSNSGYVLLGWLVERVTGIPYHEALSLFVLDPVGLPDTGYDHEIIPTAGHARGYTRGLTDYEPAQSLHPSLPYAAGMLYSTVRDLGRWAGILSEWGNAPSPFLNPKTLERMLTPELRSYGYGLGIRSRSIGREEDVRLFEHTGGIFGFSSIFRVFPEHHRLIVLLDNTASQLGPIVEGLTNLLWGTEAVLPKPSIAQRILPIVESAGVEPAIARYRNWRRTRPMQYDYSPSELMLLAQHFQTRDPTIAIAFLEAQAEEMPEALTTRFALAELYAKQGDTAQAVSHVEIALTFSPGTPRLLKRFRELGTEPDPVLRLPVVAVEPAELKRLTGEYRIDPLTSLTVELEDEFLIARLSSEPAFRLLSQSTTTFLLHGSKVQLIFDLIDGLAESVSILEGGQRVSFPRVP